MRKRRARPTERERMRGINLAPCGGGGGGGGVEEERIGKWGLRGLRRGVKRRGLRLEESDGVVRVWE